LFSLPTPILLLLLLLGMQGCCISASSESACIVPIVTCDLSLADDFTSLLTSMWMKVEGKEAKPR
jgi:hypothetical protein